MKKLLVFAALLAVSTYGGMYKATGDLLTDYTAWFAPEFKIAGDVQFLGIPNPTMGAPGAFEDSNREWSGWTANWGATGLKQVSVGNPFQNPIWDGWGHPLYLEVVFLGETAGWWNDFGYTKNGVDTLLADSVQTINKHGPKNRWFGDNVVLNLAPGESLDFFVTGSGVFGPNIGAEPTIGAQGGKYYVFDTDNNLPVGSDMQSYYGMLTPYSSVRDPEHIPGLIGDPFIVFAFEDIREGGVHRDGDFNDFIFAVRGHYDLPQGGSVPEPSTYGLMVAAVLLLAVAWRRRCTA